MKKVRKNSVNRCFDGIHCHEENPDKKREALLKKAFKEASEEKRKHQAKKRAHREINDCLRLSKGSLIKILPLVINRVADGRLPRLVLEVLIERIRANQWDKLSAGDRLLVIETEASLGKKAE